MHGRIAEKTNTGCPYAGSLRADFDPCDIAAFGKLTAWGSFVTRFLVRLRDGRVIFVKAVDQDKETEKWLRKLSRKLKAAAASREIGWRVDWLDLCVTCLAPAVAGYDDRCEECWTHAAMHAY